MRTKSNERTCTIIHSKDQAQRELIDKGLIQAKLIFEEQLRDLSAKYAEELATLRFFEELGDTKVDISQVGTETKNRVLALSIKKAEDAIVLCEKGLSSVRDRIFIIQKQIAEGYTNLNYKIVDLKEQEKHAMKHLGEAQTRLDNLIK